MGCGLSADVQVARAALECRGLGPAEGWTRSLGQGHVTAGAVLGGRADPSPGGATLPGPRVGRGGLLWDCDGARKPQPLPSDTPRLHSGVNTGSEAEARQVATTESVGRWRESRAERPVQAACLCPSERGEGRTQPGCSDWQGAGRHRGHVATALWPLGAGGRRARRLSGELCLSSESPGDSHGQVPPPQPTEATEGCDGTKGPLQSPYSPSPPVVNGGQWGGWQGALTSPWREGGV